MGWPETAISGKVNLIFERTDAIHVAGALCADRVYSLRFKSRSICSAVSMQGTCVTNRRTDRIAAVYTTLACNASHGKINKELNTKTVQQK